MERTCSGKLFPHFVLSNRTPTRVISFTEMAAKNAYIFLAYHTVHYLALCIIASLVMTVAV